MLKEKDAEVYFHSRQKLSVHFPNIFHYFFICFYFFLAMIRHEHQINGIKKFKIPSVYLTHEIATARA